MDLSHFNMLNDLVFVDTGFTKNFNAEVIGVIQKQRSWHISPDEDDQNKTVSDEYSDTGMLLSSYSYKQSDYLNIHNQNVNDIGVEIFNRILEKQQRYKFKNPVIRRLLWNYYNRSSTGVPHRDISDKFPDNFGSAVYYLNDCDGYTVVQGVEVENKAGRAIIFNPKTEHRGTGPTSSKYKYALNILFEFEECTTEI